MTDHIEYEVLLTVSVPAGQPDDAPRPFEPRFYEFVAGLVTVNRAQRLTPATNYGGPR